jgi:hypothetical protein
MEVDIVTQDSLPQPGASRRAALAGVGLAGLATTGEIPVSGGKVFVVAGPAPSPLPAKSITVAGGKITLA